MGKSIRRIRKHPTKGLHAKGDPKKARRQLIGTRRAPRLRGHDIAGRRSVVDLARAQYAYAQALADGAARAARMGLAHFTVGWTVSRHWPKAVR